MSFNYGNITVSGVRYALNADSVDIFLSGREKGLATLSPSLKPSLYPQIA